MPEYDFGRLTKRTPKRPCWVLAALDCVMLLVGLFATIMCVALIIHTEVAVDRPAETFPAADPVGITCPVCADYPEPVQFLGRYMGALTKLDANPLEIWDLTHRAFIESRFNPATVVNGNYGICGINKAAHPEVDADRLLTDPEYAAVKCLGVYRTYTNLCGNNWQCCYKRGRKGCRDWQNEGR